MPGATGGRPRTEITSDVDLRLIEELAADGLTQEQICHYLGIPISERTLRRRIQDDEDVQVVYRRGRARYMRQIFRMLIKAGSGDAATLKKINRDAITAAIFVAKAQGGWSEKQRVEHTVTRKSFEEWLRDLSENELRRLEAMGEAALLEEYERACPPSDGRD